MDIKEKKNSSENKIRFCVPEDVMEYDSRGKLRGELEEGKKGASR